MSKPQKLPYIMNIVVEQQKFSSLKGLLYAVYLDCALPTYGVWLYH